MAQDRTTVSVATGALGPVWEKLNAFLGWSIHSTNEIESIQSMLGSLQAHLLRTWGREDLGADCKEWMAEARELSYDMEDDIDDFTLAVELGGGGRDLQGLEDLLSNLEDGIQAVLSWWRKDWETTKATTAEATSKEAEAMPPPIHKEDASSAELVVGMDGPKKDLVKLLQENELVCIHGFAGTGKTTLADLVYREIGSEFECRAFVSVSKRPDVLKVLQAILSQVTTKDVQPFGRRTAEAPTQQSTINDISSYLSDKRYMVIVDDIWDWIDWEIIRMALPKGNPKCGIIVTTRVSAIAMKCCLTKEGASIYRHDGIFYRDAVTLSRTVLKKNAPTQSGMSVEVMEEVLAPKIAEMCCGMPLAVTCLSSAVSKQPWLLREDRTDVVSRDELWYVRYGDEIQKQLWQVLLLGFHQSSNNSSSSSSKIHPSLKPLAESLRLGYQDLPLHQETCLLHCSIYPTGYKKIERHGLLRKWMAEGFVYHQEEAEACLDELVHRGLLQPELASGGEGKYYSVHPMMRAFLVCKSEETNFVTSFHDDYDSRPPSLYAGPSHGHGSGGGGTDGSEASHRPTSSTAMEVETNFRAMEFAVLEALEVRQDRQGHTSHRPKLERTHRFGRGRPPPPIPRQPPSAYKPTYKPISMTRPIPRPPPSAYNPYMRRVFQRARRAGPMPIRRLSVGFERWMGMDVSRTRSIVVFPFPTGAGAGHINYWRLVPLEKLKRLRVLGLEGTGILPLSDIDLVDICSSSNLLRLRYLGLRGMPITLLPKQIVGLPNLETLDLSQTGVSELPNEIQKLWSLETLDMSNTSVRELPGEIGKLQNLKTLNVSNTSVRELPGEIGKLKNLKTLDVSNTSIRELPGEIGKLQNLKTLDVSNTSIRELPREIGELHLKTLNVSNTSVRELPGEIGKLQDLKTLNVSNTRVRGLPREIGKLKHLDTLDISYTGVRDLKPWLFLSPVTYILVGHKAVKLPDPVLAVLRQKDALHLDKLTNDGLSIMLYDHFGHPLPVARFKVHGIHHGVPELVKEHLANDSYLDIRLHKLDDDDLDFLHKMPNLQHLTLRVGQVPMKGISITPGVGFSRLESFCLDSRCRDNNSVPVWVRQHLAEVFSMDIRLHELHKDYLHFLSEMPNLQHLTLRLEVLPIEPIVFPVPGAGFSKLQSLCVDSRRGHTHTRVLDLVKNHFVGVSSLDIRLYSLDDHGLDLLCRGMPSKLQHLTLRLDQVLRSNPVVLTKTGFANLKMLCLDCCLPLVTFQQGAMPKLEHLEFKFYTSRALTTEDPVGIRHLLCLERVVFQSSPMYKSDAPGISSVINKVREEAKEHPNRITISINGKDEEVIQEKEKATKMTSASDMISEENIVTSGGAGGSSGASMIKTSIPSPYDDGSDDEMGSIIPVKSYYPFGVAK